MAGTDTAAGSRAVTRWYKAVLGPVTQSSGADGLMTLVYTSQSTAGGIAWFSGVPFSPWSSRCRHYGYVIAETLPTRTADLTVSASEATAQAYTGISISWGTSASPVTLSASHTIQELWDYSKAWGCQNVANAMPFTAVGVAGNVGLTAKANITVNTGQVLSGAGSLAMGSFTLTTELTGAYAYTFTGGTWAQASTVPTFNGGTLTLGDHATLVFTANATTIVFTPSAPSTYDLSGITPSGTLDLRNASGSFAITVQLPAGTS